MVCLVSGVMRCLRPLPMQLTCAPVPRRRSPQLRPISSLARSPVWAASRIRAWSRRPIQVAWSGASSSAWSWVGEERDQRLIVALGGDRQDALDRGGVLGVTQRGVAKQRADRGQARVAGADRVAALVLEVIEERADQRCLEIVEVEIAGRLAGVLGGEGQQQPDRVAVGGDRVRTGLPLADQPVGGVVTASEAGWAWLVAATTRALTVSSSATPCRAAARISRPA